jgi:hypothetical protein
MDAEEKAEQSSDMELEDMHGSTPPTNYASQDGIISDTVLSVPLQYKLYKRRFAGCLGIVSPFEKVYLATLMKY